MTVTDFHYFHLSFVVFRSIAISKSTTEKYNILKIRVETSIMQSNGNAWWARPDGKVFGTKLI